MAELNEIAFVEAESLLKDLGAFRWRAREVAAVVRREEGPEEIAVAIEDAINVLRSASSEISGLVYASFSAATSADVPRSDQASLL